MQDLMAIIHKEQAGCPGDHFSQYDDQRLTSTKTSVMCMPTIVTTIPKPRTATMGFKDYIRGLNELNGLKKPFIVTEFGYFGFP